MICTRRRLLGGALAGIAAGGLLRAASAGAAHAGAPDENAARRIALMNLHTGEQLDIEYFRDGGYNGDALVQIRKVLRDFRTGDMHEIDPHLMDYLAAVAAELGAEARFSVISGYRSPQTNAKLHEQSAGVAQHSLHMQGRAIDVRMAGIDCADLAAHAQGLRRGGVGYYHASNFVHLDTGAFRTWRG
jgi:uncharacterized protein YcbK (DUF882 family)